MSTDSTDNGRRRFLVAATTVVGAVGVGFAAVPFISYLPKSYDCDRAAGPVLFRGSSCGGGC